MYSSVWNFVMSCQLAGFVIYNVCQSLVSLVEAREQYTHVELSVHVIIND